MSSVPPSERVAKDIDALCQLKNGLREPTCWRGVRFSEHEQRQLAKVRERMRASLGDKAPIGKPVCEAIPSRIRHARHRSPQTQRPTVGGHPSKGNPTLAVRGQLDDRTGSTVSRLSCVLHESTRTSSFLVQDRSEERRVGKVWRLWG